MMTWVQTPQHLHAIHLQHPFLDGMLNVVRSAHGGELPADYRYMQRWS